MHLQDPRLEEKKYLGSCLKEKIKWEEVISWQNVAFYLLQRKKLEECNRVLNQRNLNSALDSPRIKESKIFGKGSRNSRRSILPAPFIPTALEVDEDSIKITVVDDINVYLSHLELEKATCYRILTFVSNR